MQEGTGTVYNRIEIVRIEAGSTEDHTKRAGETVIPVPVDISDYEAVARYYGFGQ